MTRSLILAGGGMRVAWQAGAMVALEEEGITFRHIDGTSGGIINAAMRLSGHDARAMCERWITLKVSKFVSPMRLRSYLRGPTNLVAVGDADGIREHVFPHLGIDVDEIRTCTEIAGTFNVCNFNDKTCEAIPSAGIDLDLLIAGISLPIAMPIVQKGPVAYTDAVWVKDANLLNAVDFGAEELWLLWCIGNTDRYGAGPLEQYVHMIEMSANGALFAELDRISEINRTRPHRAIRLHVVKPATPLPLDPVFFLGRIDAHTLCAMGYRDAKAYLAQKPSDGVGLDPTATKMAEPVLGVRYRERMRGRLPGLGKAELRVGVEMSEGRGNLVGSIATRDAARRWLWRGSAAIEDGEMVYRALVGDSELTVRRRLGLGSRKVALSIGEERGAFRISRSDAIRSLLSIEPEGAHGLLDRGRAIGSFLLSLRGRA